MASSTAFLASGRNGFYNQRMILACPSCHARYLISAQLFSVGPRQVRCARCSNSWQAELPPEIDAVGSPPAIDLTPVPETVLPVPSGSNLPVIHRKSFSLPSLRALALWGSFAILIIFLAGILLERPQVVKIWPGAERIYDALGLHIYHYGEGLSFIGVRSELRYDNGKMALAVEGKIHNGSPNILAIPDITALAVGVDGKTVQSWQIDAPAARISPGTDLEFHSSIDAPQDAVTEINLNFIETKNDNDK